MLGFDRVRLLGGPYVAPTCRRGDVLTCEYRGEDVRVGGMTDAPIPWPRVLKTGKPSLIVCGDLVRAIRTESEIAIAHHWGVGLVTVWKWRKSLGLEPHHPTAGVKALYRDYYPVKIDEKAFEKMRETHRSEENRLSMRRPRVGIKVNSRTLAALKSSASKPKTDAHRKAISDANRRHRIAMKAGKVKITTDHPSSSYGIPVILDDAGEPMDYSSGIKAVRNRLGLSTAQLGEKLGKSGRTIQGWEQGMRMPGTESLYVMSGLLQEID